MEKLRTTTFLLVEDDPNDVFFIERAFKKIPGLQINSVQDGVQAIQYLEGNGKYSDRQTYPIPEILLTDLKMPRLNGFEFLDWLRNKAAENLRTIPTIVMSSSSMQSDILECYRLGADSYIVKSVDWEDFRQRVYECMAQFSKTLPMSA